MFIHAFALFALVFEGHSLRCFSGQNVLHNTNSDDESAIPVRLKTCSSQQACGTVNYHISYYDITLRKHSFSVNQGVCVHRDNCARSSTYCLRYRAHMSSRGLTVNNCQVECCFSNYCNTKVNDGSITINKRLVHKTTTTKKWTTEKNDGSNTTSRPLVYIATVTQKLVTKLNDGSVTTSKPLVHKTAAKGSSCKHVPILFIIAMMTFWANVFLT